MRVIAADGTATPLTVSGVGRNLTNGEADLSNDWITLYATPETVAGLRGEPGYTTIGFRLADNSREAAEQTVAAVRDRLRGRGVRPSMTSSSSGVRLQAGCLGRTGRPPLVITVLVPWAAGGGSPRLRPIPLIESADVDGDPPPPPPPSSPLPPPPPPPPPPRSPRSRRSLSRPESSSAREGSATSGSARPPGPGTSAPPR